MLAGAVMADARGTVTGIGAVRIRKGHGNGIGIVALYRKTVDRLVLIGFRTDNTAIFVIQKTVRVRSFVQRKVPDKAF